VVQNLRLKQAGRMGNMRRATTGRDSPWWGGWDESLLGEQGVR